MRNVRHGAIAGLLVVVATLLAINLVVIAPSQEARADDDSSDDDSQRGRNDRAVALWVSDFGPVVFRMFPDGTIESNRGIGPGGPMPEPCGAFVWCGWQVIPEEPLP